MAVAGSKTFKSGNSEAVRLPKDIAYGREIDLTIVRSGEVLTIYPARPSLAEMAQKLTALPRPSEIEIRDEEDLPERPGL